MQEPADDGRVDLAGCNPSPLDELAHAAHVGVYRVVGAPAKAQVLDHPVAKSAHGNLRLSGVLGWTPETEGSRYPDAMSDLSANWPGFVDAAINAAAVLLLLWQQNAMPFVLHTANGVDRGAHGDESPA